MRCIIAAALAAVAVMTVSAQRYVGGDISLLPEYEQAGAQYKDADGKPIAEVLPYLRSVGMNAMRVRVFVNPEDYSGADADKNACQSLEYVLPLCKRIKECGLSLMVDFHYSDTWADPAKQWTPKAWAGQDDEELCETIYEYTRRSLAALKEAGATPDFVQPGNEISYGMLWGIAGTPEAELKKTLMGSDANWARLGNLLRNAIKACREECPEAGVVIHTERVAQVDVMNNFYDRMESLGIDYDIIGLSYYPYFHGNLRVLDAALNDVEMRYPDKQIMIVETGYPYKWEVPGSTEKVDYPYTDAGQNEFASRLVDLLLRHERVDGLFWWWLEYNAYGTSLSGWYNAPLFDSTTGKACSALRTICRFGSDTGGVEKAPADEGGEEVWYDVNGRRVVRPTDPGIYVSRNRKIVVR